MNFNKENLSPSAITKELQEAVISLPGTDGWQDYFEGGAGRTIIELIAGSQAIKNHYNLMRVRESSLQYAKLESSVTELAMNKGVYKPCAKTVIGEITYTAMSSGVINVGEEVGTYSNYKMYANESSTYSLGSDNTLQFIIGNKQEESVIITDDVEFSILDVIMSNKYITDEFQYLTVNGDDVVIASEQLNLYDANITNSCLRIVYENRVKLIFGDDIVGKLLNKTDEVIYNYMEFGDTLIKNFNPDNTNFNLLSHISSIENTEILREASGYINKENLRRIALRNSIDGRWVLPQDYENGIIRDYGEYFYDIIVIDSYPIEKIYYLEKEGMFTNALKIAISSLIDNRRGNAVLVEETYIDPELPENYSIYEYIDGTYDSEAPIINPSFSFEYIGNDSDDYINEAIELYKEQIEFKFKDGDYILSSDEVAVDLTKLLSENAKGKFYDTIYKSYIITEFRFIKNLDIEFVR